jgi:hypothetical protein
MGVASCRGIFRLPDVVFNRVFVLSRFGFRFAIRFRSVVVRVVGFRLATQPSLAQPGPALAVCPWCSTSPYARPPSLSLSLIQFSRAQLPLFHLSLLPYALGSPVTVIAGFGSPR